MAQKRRDSDLSSELYFSVYGNNRKLKPQKIRTCVLYKPLLENTATNNFVIAAKETNEICISFKEGSDSKVFTFDKVFYCDMPQDEFYLLTKSVIQDVMMGLNSFLILSDLVSTASPEIKNSFAMDLSRNVIANVLKELILFVNKEENMDCSLHISYFEMHGDKIIDLLRDCDENRDMQIYENPDKDTFEVKGLTEKPIYDDKGILEIFKKQSLLGPECIFACCHLMIIVTMIRRNINNDGLEFIKVGKLTLVQPAECKSGYLGNIRPNTDDCLLKFAENCDYPTSSKSKMLTILKPAFGENATTTFIILLSSVLHVLEKDLRILQFVSKIGNIMTHPEIDLQLIIRNSTKEYAEEIKELQKDLDATSKCTGVRVDHLFYRSLKNYLAFENEKGKNLDGQVLGLTDSVNFKKQQIISLHAALECKETEIQEVEQSLEILKLELQEMENENNIIKKVSSKADAIVGVKQMIISNEQFIKELKLELVKDNRNYETLMQSILLLKNELTSFLCDIDAQNTSQKSTLELLIVDMNNTFLEFQYLEKDLTTKLSNLLDIDALIKAWKNCKESLTANFSYFMHEKHELFTSMKIEMNNPLANLHTSKNAVTDEIRNNWSEKGAVLKYYLSKMQVFGDSSFKMLEEIIHHMDMIKSSHQAEFTAISAAFGSTNEAFKKFVYDISTTLKSFHQYFEEQKKELLKTTEIISFQQKFKKQFDEKIDDMKQFLLDFKQMYLEYNDASTSKWNEIQKSCQKTIQKQNELSDHLSLFQNQISKYVNNLPQQNINTLEYSLLKDKTDNVENRILQISHMHKEMEENLGEALEVYNKGIDKEFQEIKKYTSLRKTEIEKYFDTFSLKLKDCSSNFSEDLRSIHEFSSDSKDKLEEYLDSLSSSVSLLMPLFDNYLLTSNNILAKSERSFIIIPSVSEDKSDNISEIENLFLEEWKVVASTPNMPKKKEFNICLEKEKLIHRMKSLAEQQIPQTSNTSVLVYEEKETKNASTVSLPNLRTHSKAAVMTEKTFPRLKCRKK